MICGHLDSSDLDDHPIDFARLERNYTDSMAARNIVVARLLGTQSPHADSVAVEFLPLMSTDKPEGL